MCYPVCGMVHIKEPLLLIVKSSLCGVSGFPFSLSEWSLTITDAIEYRVPITNSGVIPIINSGVIPITNSGVIPITNSGVIPITNSGVIPITNSGVIPITNSGVIPITNSGVQIYACTNVFRDYSRVLFFNIKIIPSTQRHKQQ